MKFRVIDLDRAPTDSKPVNRTRQLVTQLIHDLPPDKVAVVTPEKDETLRGLKSSITRASNREDRKVRVWDVDGKVYVRLTN